MVPAISDATGPVPHSFAFEWLKDEEGERRAQMVTLAKDQVRIYVDAQAEQDHLTREDAQPARRPGREDRREDQRSISRMYKMRSLICRLTISP